MRDRNHEAAIQYQTSLLDDMTGIGGEWVEFAQCYADVRPLRGEELFHAQQVQAQATYLIETEFIPHVKPQMRVRVPQDELVNQDDIEADVNFRVFEIRSAINVNEANRSLELLCIETVI